jgi:Nif-specific regulatory protein
MLVYKSSAMKNVVISAKKYAQSNANVIVTGANGVGKEVVANLLHYGSKRCDKPFIKINCSAIPENLFESELFGFRKGAFTGANTEMSGKFEMAASGTIFLDELVLLRYNKTC